MLGFEKSSQEREKLHVPCWWSSPPRPGSAVPAAAESPAPAQRRRPAGPWGRRAVWLWPRAPRRRWRRWGCGKGHSLASLGGDPARPREAATAASAAWLRTPPAVALPSGDGGTLCGFASSRLARGSPASRRASNTNFGKKMSAEWGEIRTRGAAEGRPRAARGRWGGRFNALKQMFQGRWMELSIC